MIGESEYDAYRGARQPIIRATGGTRFMALTGLDIVVLLAIGGAAVLGFIRGFVTEVLALGAWLAVVLVLKLFHAPFAELMSGAVGTAQGGAVLAFAILAGVTYLGGRLIANTIGSRCCAASRAAPPPTSDDARWRSRSSSFSRIVMVGESSARRSGYPAVRYRAQRPALCQ